MPARPGNRTSSPRHRGPVAKSAIAQAAAYSSDDREILALLALPFLLLTLAMAASQSLRQNPGLGELIARAPVDVQEQSLARPATPAGQLAVARPELPKEKIPAAAVPPPAAVAPVVAPTMALPQGSLAEIAAARPEQVAVPEHSGVSPSALAVAPEREASVPAAQTALPPAAEAIAAAQSTVTVATVTPLDETRAAETKLALADPVPSPAAVPAVPVTAAPGDALGETSSEAAVVSPAKLPVEVAVRAEGETAQCVPSGTFSLKPAVTLASFVPGEDAEAFGLRLAAAARSQTREFVIYNDKYTTLAYPLGDVPALYGVCTDVLVRAYREMGLDLQQLVHQSRIGSGDTNIDHRRVDTLRKFFAAFGESLPITQFADDFRPGDIVSYYRPQNAHSRTHIAVVADVLGPSGRPMIIHNRGWGPQMEDALFVDEMTGHYRYSGAKRPAVAKSPVAAKPRPAPQSKASASRPTGPMVKTALPGDRSSAGTALRQQKAN